MSWRSVARLRRLSRREDALSQDLDTTHARSAGLQNAFLSQQLATHQLGGWALSAESLNFLETRIHAERPTVVLEFGSGISTACLARYMYELHGANRLFVVSIEQSPDHATRTLELLRVLGLDALACVVVCPIRDCVIEEYESACYELGDALRNALGTRRADFVVIDGPAGDAGCRFGTLPLIRHYVRSQTPFFLDDALRDGELQIAAMWNKLADIKVDDIHLVGKGLLTGFCNVR